MMKYINKHKHIFIVRMCEMSQTFTTHILTTLEIKDLT